MTGVKDAVPAVIPVSYLSFFDVMSDPAKLVGLGVLVLQAIYILIKIYKELRENNGAIQKG